MNDLLDSWRAHLLPPIHDDGWKFIAAFAGVSALLGAIAGFLGWIGAILTVWCLYFFRDPKRVVPQGDDLVVSPADGLVCAITEAAPPEELEMGEASMTRISVFLSVFDVHVNRSPVAGTVSKAAYRPGKTLNAALDKASEENERRALRIASAKGPDVAVVQIAGLVARRILGTAEENDSLQTGERIGLIRFGSRVDVYLPKGTKVMVAEGQRAVGGETVLATLGAKGDAPATALI